MFERFKPVTKYKLRDWCFSRQRKWGCPIPIIHCSKCGVIPSIKPFLLSDAIDVKCHKCDQTATRETDTMDTFMDSSWYFLRYPCADNNDRPFDERVRQVDLYIGGAEHATLHLIYARAIVKALRDQKMLTINEPFRKLINQGMVLAPYYQDSQKRPVYLNDVVHKEVNGQDKYFNINTKEEVFCMGHAKMSKSLLNVVTPEEVFNSHGVESCRFFIASIPVEVDMDWNTRELNGCARFLDKIASFCSIMANHSSKNESNHELFLSVHKMLLEANQEIKLYKLNTYVSRIRILFNLLENAWKKNDRTHTLWWSTAQFLILLWPLCPQLAAECYMRLFNNEITNQRNYTFQFFTLESSQVFVYFNNKLRGSIQFSLNNEQLIENAKNLLRPTDVYNKILFPNDKIIKFTT